MSNNMLHKKLPLENSTAVVDDLDGMMQTVILELKDGRNVVFTGPAQIRQGDILVNISCILPYPIPNGCTFQKLHRAEEV